MATEDFLRSHPFAFKKDSTLGPACIAAATSAALPCPMGDVSTDGYASHGHDLTDEYRAKCVFMSAQLGNQNIKGYSQHKLLIRGFFSKLWPLTVATIVSGPSFFHRLGSEPKAIRSQVVRRV